MNYLIHPIKDDSFLKIYNMCDELKESFVDFMYYLSCMNDLGGTYNIAFMI